MSILYSNRGGSRIFFRRGCTRLLLYFNTNKPHSFFFCCRIPVVLENRRSSQGRGGAHPLHPPLRSAPAIIIVHSIHLFLSFYVGKHHRVNLQFSFSRCVIIFSSSSWINTLCYVMLCYMYVVLCLLRDSENHLLTQIPF